MTFMRIHPAPKDSRDRCWKRYFSGILLVLLCYLASAKCGTNGESARKSEHIVLTVSRADGNAPPVKFALKDIEKLERKDYLTMLPKALGVSGRHDWQGIPLRAVLKAANARGYSQLRVTALDGYEVYLPATDLTRFDPILAYRKDDQYIGILDKGPLFLIYPFDSNPQLQTMEYINRTIWQVNAIILK
jgi:hypothetical protein